MKHEPNSVLVYFASGNHGDTFWIISPWGNHSVISGKHFAKEAIQLKKAHRGRFHLTEDISTVFLGHI